MNVDSENVLSHKLKTGFTQFTHSKENFRAGMDAGPKIWAVNNSLLAQ